MTGYLHRDYAHSLTEYGIPCELPHSGGWILERQISGFPYHDAMGCYPLFVCQDWSQLHIDLEHKEHKFISISLVTDPFGNYDMKYLKQCFETIVIPFKEHFVVDLHRPTHTFVCNHHRRYARKALQNLYIERCEQPIQFVNEWIDLYANLTEKHNIKGILSFSELAFRKQFYIPGITVFRAMCEEKTVGMLLWYIQDGVGYYHLGASSDLGYKLRASFALFWFAIEYFAAIGLRWLNLGAGAGIQGDGTDGLTRFKRGWSTGTQTAYLCGRIFDQKRYLEIVRARGIPETKYFPAYRLGEFQ